MSATYKIRRFLAKLPTDEMFQTAQLLTFGTRAAIDKALSRMVATGAIQRLARGLFIVSIEKANSLTAMEVAQRKAKPFGHSVMEHAADVAHRLRIISEPNLQPTFATSGSSSSFMFKGATRVFYKRSSPKKRQLAGTKMGDIIRSLWYLGRRSCDQQTLMDADYSLGRSDRMHLPALAALMPTWLHALFVWH